MTTASFATFVCVLVAFIQCSSAFQLGNRGGRTTLNPVMRSEHPQTSTSLVILHYENPNQIPDEERLDIGEQFEGSVDWDAEWKKVVENRDQPAKRPGPRYKSDLEIKAIKTTNNVAKNVFDASKEIKASLPRMPNIRSLQGDWKFWIGIMVVVSFGLSILSVSGQSQTNESFYI
eukprot:CCRYP_017341-RA/>CCRYP_017341-RA protein AED:0.24 eAED:0.38 QI:0/0/0/1/1/1/2/0/174